MTPGPMNLVDRVARKIFACVYDFHGWDDPGAGVELARKVCRKAAQAALDSLWQDISEAPRDGTQIDISSTINGRRRRDTNCSWERNRWIRWVFDVAATTYLPVAINLDGTEPTHFMHITAPGAE